MRKVFLMSALSLIVSVSTFAGGLLTNTNQHVSFLRMIARGASVDIDGVYYNPAGLGFLPTDGLYLSLNGQSAYQTRVIDATFPLFPEGTRNYKGTASAPFIPSVQVAYKNENWVFSGSFAVGGGGGKASFDTGLPMFDALVMGSIYKATNGSITPDKYTINSAMDGRQFIYGLQFGASYKVNDWLSVFGGGRMNYFTGGYEGFLNANLKQVGTELVAIELDCDQTGWGLTPIIGADVKLGKWNIGLKYEFMTSLNLENKTRKAEVRQSGTALAMDENNPLAAYRDGVNTPSDIPALLTAAVGYEILPTLRASVEYHFFDDKQAGMAGEKQEALKGGTNEYLMGIEWDVHDRVSISGGYQRTDYGLADDFQSDTSFSCDSYSLGFGAGIKLSSKLKLNVAYFWTNYSDYTKEMDNYNGLPLGGTDVYSRTNKVFGLGVDYKF